jgi:hypothetical protein
MSKFLPETLERPTLHTVAVPGGMFSWSSTDFVVVGPTGRQKLSGFVGCTFQTEGDACTFGRKLAGERGLEFAPGLYRDQRP